MKVGHGQGHGHGQGQGQGHGHGHGQGQGQGHGHGQGQGQGHGHGHGQGQGHGHGHGHGQGHGQGHGHGQGQGHGHGHGQGQGHGHGHYEKTKADRYRKGELKMKYRKKTIVIEAIKFTGRDSVFNMESLWGKPWVDACYYDSHTEMLFIQTLEGVIKGSIGDYIIKGIKGEFYPVKEDVFCLCYEKIE